MAVIGETDDDEVEVIVEAGAVWDELVARTVAEGWSGIEALSGIPGSVGATPIQNVGAYGQEVADVITAVRTWDRETGTERRFAPADCNFAYRDSLFKHTSRFVVTAVEFRLSTGGQGAPVRYAELARTLGVEVGAGAPVAAVRDAVLGLRRGKGMVLDPADHDTWSAGSFFTNPILSAAVAAAALPDDAPRYPSGDGLVKTSAAWLIEHAGFTKGFGADLTGGRATLSTKHTLALTNRGTATAADLLTLARAIRTGVIDRFGIELHHEPVLLGLTL
jgi:UDP-N-acetylmuramate dehydrogenase